MLEKMVKYFANRHLLTNFIYIGVIIAGLFYWGEMKKEETPNITFDRVHVSASYSGASPEQVEYFITKELEDKLSGIDGIDTITSVSSFGSSSISVSLEPGRPDRSEIINEIRTAVADARLPDDVIDDPRVREFKSTQMPIIDVGLYFKGVHLLNEEQRKTLQSYALALEDRLINLKEISGSNRRGYVAPEIRIEVIPEKIRKYNISVSKIASVVAANNALFPAGSLEDIVESRVTLNSELNSKEKLSRVIIQGGFEGQKVYLKDIAEIKDTFEKNTRILKINGREGIFINAVKKSDAGILEAMDALKRAVNSFKKNNLKDTGVEVVFLDDASYDVKNRLSIIASNGTIGLIFVIASLLLLLNRRTALWVALGIPFTFCFTIIVSHFLGYTVNNVTLAAVIIVMGMIVDDAIIVAENISRTRASGISFETAAVKGTTYVLLPVTAAIITTCVAFTPLLYFTGRMGEMVKHTTPIIYIMLTASFIESIFILPSHMNMHAPEWLINLKNRFTPGPRAAKPGLNKKQDKTKEERVRHWFIDVEDRYGKLLEKAIKHKYIIFAFAAALIIISGLLATQVMKYSMFPREESRFTFITGSAPKGFSAEQTAESIRQIEDVFLPYIGKEVVGLRSSLGISRRGRSAGENAFRLWIELVSKEKRKKSLKQLTAEWQEKIKPFENDFNSLKFSQQWWGSDSGSAIEIKVKSNNDRLRSQACEDILAGLKKIPDIANPEIDTPQTNPEYLIELDREKITRLGINPSSIRTTLRSILDGAILYEIKGEDEEIKVRLTTTEYDKSKIDKVLDIPVENAGSYLVPLKNVVTFKKTTSSDTIEREDYKRISKVFADLAENTKKTPLEIASYLEENIFPEIESKYPTVALSFGGEIEDSRESGENFRNAVITVLVIIYIILALLLNSMGKPFIILLTVPFGIVGVIFALLAHGQLVYGFFSVIGALGLIGVVINGSIVMLVKLERELKERHHCDLTDKEIADIAKTRLQAVTLTTITTVLAVLPTAYGWLGYDSMLAEMMLALAYGLLFGTVITLVLVPCGYAFQRDIRRSIDSKFCARNKDKGAQSKRAQK